MSARPGRPEAAEAIWRTDEPLAGSSARRVRWRALGRATLGAVACGVLLLGFARPTAAAIVGAISGLTLALGLASPLAGYAALQRMLLGLGRAVGALMTLLLLGPIFYLVVTPFGLLRRRGRRDTLRRRFEPKAETYWRKRSEDEQVVSTERPY